MPLHSHHSDKEHQEHEEPINLGLSSPSDVAANMKPFFPLSPGPTGQLTRLANDRLRAVKDRSDGDSHTDSASDMGLPVHARHFSLPDQSEESSRDDRVDEKNEEEEVSDTLIRIFLR